MSLKPPTPGIHINPKGSRNAQETAPGLAGLIAPCRTSISSLKVLGTTLVNRPMGDLTCTAAFSCHTSPIPIEVHQSRRRKQEVLQRLAAGHTQFQEKCTGGLLLYKFPHSGELSKTHANKYGNSSNNKY